MPSTPSSTSRVSVSNGAAPGDRRQQLVHGPAVHRRVIATICWARTSSGLRGISVVSIAPSCIRRVTTAHSSRSPRYFGKMTPLLGAPTWWPARPTRCSPRATLGRALDLDDEVDRAHVDPELERAAWRRWPGAGPALSSSSIAQPLLPGDAAVVGPDQLLAGELVEPLGEPLGEAPAVDEHDRAAVRPDQLQDPRVDRRPDAGPQVAAPAAGPPGCSSGGRTSPSAAMSSTGTTTWSSSGLRAPASTIGRRGRDRRRPGTGRSPRAAAAWRTARSAGGRGVGRRRPLKPFQAQGEVCAALGAARSRGPRPRSRLHAPEHLARRRGEHQVQRFGGRDQDVRRVAGDLRVAPRRACRRSAIATG